jgi:hypothetical protein
MLTELGCFPPLRIKWYFWFGFWDIFWFSFLVLVCFFFCLFVFGDTGV